jgi:hypothetical protein
LPREDRQPLHQGIEPLDLEIHRNEEDDPLPGGDAEPAGDLFPAEVAVKTLVTRGVDAGMDDADPLRRDAVFVYKDLLRQAGDGKEEATAGITDQIVLHTGCCPVVKAHPFPANLADPEAVGDAVQRCEIGPEDPVVGVDDVDSG